MKYAIVFMLVTTIYFELNQACKRNHVVIHNELAPGYILHIRCRNIERKQDDRNHTMNFKDPYYIISFKDSQVRNSWRCELSYGTNPNKYYDLEVYKRTDLDRCGQLRSWSARLDGIWFTKNYGSPPGLVRSWKTRN